MARSSCAPAHPLTHPPCSWFYDTKLYWAECSWPCTVFISYGERFVYCLILGFYVQVGGRDGGGGGRGEGNLVSQQVRCMWGARACALHPGICWPSDWLPTCPACPDPPPSGNHPRQAVPMLFLWETKRKDRLEVFAHHVATIILIAYSYYLGWVFFFIIVFSVSTPTTRGGCAGLLGLVGAGMCWWCAAHEVADGQHVGWGCCAVLALALVGGGCAGPLMPPPPCTLPPTRSLTRVGVMVLVCHESNDIFLEAAKVGDRAGLWGVLWPERRRACTHGNSDVADAL